MRSATILATAVLLTSGRLLAQIPDQCLEIERILVDACNPAATCAGSSEGQNEMVSFITGPLPIALSDFEADWPNNSWLGLVQNATTADLTAQLNATISSCGRLLEPPDATIPAGSRVLLVTSTEMCVAGNSFSGLSDTLYIIFQEGGNTQGHFANNPAAGQPISPTPPAGATARTLILMDNATGCADTATYIREQLLNNEGTYGGQGGESDGGTAVFSWPGTAQVSYVNLGCQAPFEPVAVDAAVDGVLCGGTGTVSLTGSIQGGTFTTVQWSGGSGTFTNATALNTSYTAGPDDDGTVVLTLCVQTTTCTDPVCTTLNVASGSGPTITFGPDPIPGLCPGDQLTLTANGADTYQWATGESTDALLVTQPGTYTVTGTNGCGSSTASVTVPVGSGIVVTINGLTQLCNGASTVLTASGASTYIWSSGEFGPSITVSQPGTYSVTGSNNCGTATESVSVTFGVTPVVNITGDLSLCAGETTTLTASGASQYTWSDQSTGPILEVSSAGTYSVTGTNACGTASAQVSVSVEQEPTVVIDGATAICPGGSTTLTASGADSYVWSTNVNGPVISVNTPGVYTVTGTNGCGASSASVDVEQLELPTVVVSGAEVICPGEQLVLTATATGAVSWNSGGTGNTLTVSGPGLYVATATNLCGTASDAFNVSASEVDAAISASPLIGPAPLSVSFSGPAQPTGMSYAWDFDDGGASAVEDPTHVFDGPGSYVVGLMTTLGDCTAQSTITIVVQAPAEGSESSISIPNVFTPNGDRANDLLLIQAVNIVSVEVVIYNRWGQPINELKRVGEAWDARTSSGQLVPDGTYYYSLTATGRDGRSFAQSGHITVLR